MNTSFLDPSLKQKIVRIILGYKDVQRILLFGSRARGDSKPTSDIDLAIVDKNWSDTDINLAKNALEENLKTPLKIDLLNVATLEKPRLKQIILKEGLVLYESKTNQRAA